MKTYEVTVKQGPLNNNFFNLSELEEVKSIDLAGYDKDGNGVYEVKTTTDLDRELELIDGVLSFYTK